LNFGDNQQFGFYYLTIYFVNNLLVFFLLLSFPPPPLRRARHIISQIKPYEIERKAKETADQTPEAMTSNHLTSSYSHPDSDSYPWPLEGYEGFEPLPEWAIHIPIHHIYTLSFIHPY